MERCRSRQTAVPCRAVRLEGPCHGHEGRARPPRAHDNSPGDRSARASAFACGSRALSRRRIITHSEDRPEPRLAIRTSGAARERGVHRLPHTFCSHLAMRGAPARAIQELAGHMDLATTQRYMHLSPAAIEGAIRLLDQAKPVHGFGDISNDVGTVKTHVDRSGRRSRLSLAKESAEAAVSGGQRCRMSTPQRSKCLTASMTVLPTKHLFGHTGTMMTHANSHRREAGRLFILPVTIHGPHLHTGIPAYRHHRAAARNGARRQNSS
jgi:Phage integrase family